MADRSQIRVAVSGISGFIGAQIAADLLARGYIVHGTVRSNTPNQVAHLTSLEVPGRLEVFEADMKKDGSFDEPLMGCTCAFHVASPYILKTSDPKTDMIEPAIQGALNFLSACVKASVSKVILTSSIGAIADLGQPNKVFNEADWNDEHEERAIPFYYSKVAAERAAWSYATENKLNLIVINPSLVLGPSLIPRLNPSNLFIRDIASGRIPVIVNLELPAVDVRDVSEAHIRAMETENASGRYICTAKNLHLEQIAATARANGLRATRIRLTSRLATEIMRGLLTFSKQTNELYPEELGVTFRDMDTTLIDSFNDMIEWGHLRKS
ncbi:NAD-dependent epimerase/dehydratase [Gracilaria domingensis]|nr:NAD-dependent epimerase/dehydratase [Gracilaria domingensis]